MSVFFVSPRVWLLALAAMLTCAGSGCTTVLSTASLRDLVLGLDDRVDDSTIQPPPDSADSSEDEENDTADTERRAAAIEEAISRLSKVGELDDATRTTLVATLQRTDQEDWPVVVEAFAESLGDAPATHVVAKADLDRATVAAEEPPRASVLPEPPTAPEPASAPTPTSVDTAEAAVKLVEPITAGAPTTVAPVPEPAPAPDPEATPAPLATPSPVLMIRNAAFASRVQTWGVLDRFADDRFRPGQEVIIYFELENLSAGESAAGHTTCIDSRLRLVTDTGDVAHEWTFEPIAETCRARRHDYFARYMVRVPADAKPGRHRVELTVTDTLSGQAATEAIHFDVVPASPSAE